MEDNNILADLLKQEQKIVRNQLLNHGLAFYVPKLSLLKYLPGKRDDNGAKVRTLTLYKPYLKTMDALSEIKLQLKINMAELEQDPINFKNKIIKSNALLMARIVAYSLLNRSWKIRIFGNWLTNYIANRVTSEKLVEITDLIDEMEDAGNFINSTVLMSGTGRTSAPKAEKIETSPTIKEKQ